MRVFVALDIPEEVRAALGKLTARLRTSCRAARWVRIEGVHLTLKFIGEVQPEIIEPIKASLSRIRSPDTIELKYRNVGFFPDERRPSVFWTGIDAGPELGALAAAVETSLEPLGIAKEQRAFSPHLTLARFETRRGPGARSGFALGALTKAISEAGPLEFGAGIANEFHLYQSILKSGGAEYTRLATFRFTGDESR